MQNATGNFTCYAADAYESGALHRVLLGLGQGGPLPPDTTIFYKVGDPELGMSQEFNFTTQPVTGQQALPYRSVVSARSWARSKVLQGLQASAADCSPSCVRKAAMLLDLQLQHPSEFSPGRATLCQRCLTGQQPACPCQLLDASVL